MPTPARSLMTLEEMPGWLTFGEAATELKVSVERVRQLATSGKLKTARRVGRRPIGLVREAEITELVARRKAAAAVAAGEADLDQLLDGPRHDDGPPGESDPEAR